MSRLLNIHRIDTDANKTHAWLVTFQRRNEIINKMFSDTVHGGKRKALKAAIEFRDALRLQHSPVEHAIWVRTRLRKNNRSGIPGVGRYERPVNPVTGHRSPFWQAAWIDENGKYWRRKFAVSIYGEREARRLAVAERERQLKRVCDLKASLK